MRFLRSSTPFYALSYLVLSIGISFSGNLFSMDDTSEPAHDAPSTEGLRADSDNLLPAGLEAVEKRWSFCDILLKKGAPQWYACLVEEKLTKEIDPEARSLAWLCLKKLLKCGVPYHKALGLMRRVIEIARREEGLTCEEIIYSFILKLDSTKDVGLALEELQSVVRGAIPGLASRSIVLSRASSDMALRVFTDDLWGILCQGDESQCLFLSDACRRKACEIINRSPDKRAVWGAITSLMDQVRDKDSQEMALDLVLAHPEDAFGQALSDVEALYRLRKRFLSLYEKGLLITGEAVLKQGGTIDELIRVSDRLIRAFNANSSVVGEQLAVLHCALCSQHASEEKLGVEAIGDQIISSVKLFDQRVHKDLLNMMRCALEKNGEKWGDVRDAVCDLSKTPSLVRNQSLKLFTQYRRKNYRVADLVSLIKSITVIIPDERAQGSAFYLAWRYGALDSINQLISGLPQEDHGTVLSLYEQIVYIDKVPDGAQRAISLVQDSLDQFKALDNSRPYCQRSCAYRILYQTARLKQGILDGSECERIVKAVQEVFKGDVSEILAHSPGQAQALRFIEKGLCYNVSVDTIEKAVRAVSDGDLDPDAEWEAYRLCEWAVCAAGDTEKREADVDTVLSAISQVTSSVTDPTMHSEVLFFVTRAMKGDDDDYDYSYSIDRLESDTQQACEVLVKIVDVVKSVTALNKNAERRARRMVLDCLPHDYITSPEEDCTIIARRMSHAVLRSEENGDSGEIQRKADSLIALICCRNLGEELHLMIEFVGRDVDMSARWEAYSMIEAVYNYIDCQDAYGVVCRLFVSLSGVDGRLQGRVYTLVKQEIERVPKSKTTEKVRLIRDALSTTARLLAQSSAPVDEQEVAYDCVARALRKGWDPTPVITTINTQIDRSARIAVYGMMSHTYDHMENPFWSATAIDSLAKRPAGEQELLCSEIASSIAGYSGAVDISGGSTCAHGGCEYMEECYIKNAFDDALLFMERKKASDERAASRDASSDEGVDQLADQADSTGSDFRVPDFPVTNEAPALLDNTAQEAPRVRNASWLKRGLSGAALGAALYALQHQMRVANSKRRNINMMLYHVNDLLDKAGIKPLDPNHAHLSIGEQLRAIRTGVSRRRVQSADTEAVIKGVDEYCALEDQLGRAQTNRNLLGAGTVAAALLVGYAFK